MSGRWTVDVEQGVLRAARLDGQRLDDLMLLPLDDPLPAGAIYVGRVRRVLDGIDGAFVDFGGAADGFLRAAQAHHADWLDSGLEPDAPDRDAPPAAIGEFVTEGMTLAVQVVRPGGSGKGPLLTTDIALAGRYAVLRLCDPTLTLSRRLGAPDERQRLQDAFEPLLDDETGLIARTAAPGADADAIAAEVAALRRRYAELVPALEAGRLGLVDGGAPAPLRFLRDLDLGAGDTVLLAAQPALEGLRTQAAERWPDLADRLVVARPGEDPWADGALADEIATLLEPEVALPGGARLIVEHTAALTVIDVDTGGASERGDAIVATNLDAADEIARQLRLRNIGGAVVVDFVRMSGRRQRDEVVEALREAVAGDRAPVQVLAMSPLGLVEMSRERIGPPLAEIVEKA